MLANPDIGVTQIAHRLVFPQRRFIDTFQAPRKTKQRAAESPR
jgi:hypothetical protein